jgi:hypothetical protein
MAPLLALVRSCSRKSPNPVDRLDAHGLKDIGLDEETVAKRIAASRQDAFRLLGGRYHL